MRVVLKTLLIFSVFQLIKLIIFIIQQFMIDVSPESIEVNSIIYFSIISKYLPIVILLSIFVWNGFFSKNRENIISFVLASVLETLLLDKFIFIYFNSFVLRIIINMIIYTLILIISYLIYKKYFGTILKK
ncbi:hypothetical protein [Chryseobacterium lacus]|uniref:hypothetical protein n=1 Tax=Chryseobacterium lacus TaxID=2058346 RepID=UPI000F884AF5|nr:hypothetical protein [Chryseobacterium lacus]RST27720.1 hypothetical protein EIZ46_05280 [Chryseobacterium lacus]HRN49511.1 hypothetical protein [Niabella sp.]